MLSPYEWRPLIIRVLGWGTWNVNGGELLPTFTGRSTGFHYRYSRRHKSRRGFRSREFIWRCLQVRQTTDSNVSTYSIYQMIFFRSSSFKYLFSCLCFRFERHAVLPKFLAGRVEAWRQEACLFNADPTVVGSARRALPIGAVDAYSLMASLGGRRLTPRGPYIHYTEEACILSKSLCTYRAGNVTR